MRSEPEIDKNNLNSNVLARLPDGHLVQAVTGKQINGFLEVETSLLGAHLLGFASTKFLKAVKPASGIDAVPVLMPASAPTASSIVAVC